MPARLDLGATIAAVGTAAPAPAGSDRAASVDRVLDAALDRFVAQGLRATTMADIAEAAGLSRVWVHRLVGSRDDLVQAVLTREVERVLVLLMRMGPVDPDPVVAFGDAVGLVVAQFAGHPLVRRLVDDEADQVVAAFTDGRFLSLVSQRIASLMAAQLRVPAVAVRPIAEASTRVSVSLMIAPMSPGGDDPATVSELIVAAFGPALRSVTEVTGTLS